MNHAPKKPVKKKYHARQPSLFQSDHIGEKESIGLKEEWRKLSRRTHGGDQAKGQRKEFRPLDKKKWTHLILKSTRATGALSFLRPKNQIFIAKTLEKKARKFGVTIHSSANVGNHLHIKLRFKNRSEFQNFLRSMTTLISRFVTGARKGKPFGKFWDSLAYTRVVTSKKEELQLRGYIEANQIEASVSKSVRFQFLKEFNDWIQTLGKDNPRQRGSA